MINCITVEKAFIEQDIEWKYLNYNSFHLLIQKIFVLTIVLLVSILLVTPVSLYVVVQPIEMNMRNKLSDTSVMGQ